MNLVQQNDPIQSHDSHHILYSTEAAHTIMDFLLLTPVMWAARISVSTASKGYSRYCHALALKRGSFQMAGASHKFQLCAAHNLLSSVK